MIVDCDRCQVRGDACGDCVISVLLGRPEHREVNLDGAEQRALAVLADAGMVPKLRLVPVSPAGGSPPGVGGNGEGTPIRETVCDGRASGSAERSPRRAV
jgi:hypothetical protein